MKTSNRNQTQITVTFIKLKNMLAESTLQRGVERGNHKVSEWTVGRGVCDARIKKLVTEYTSASGHGVTM